jgi:hypothetical protein
LPAASGRWRASLEETERFRIDLEMRQRSNSSMSPAACVGQARERRVGDEQQALLAVRCRGLPYGIGIAGYAVDAEALECQTRLKPMDQERAPQAR